MEVYQFMGENLCLGKHAAVSVTDHRGSALHDAADRWKPAVHLLETIGVLGPLAVL